MTARDCERGLGLLTGFVWLLVAGVAGQHDDWVFTAVAVVVTLITWGMTLWITEG